MNKDEESYSQVKKALAWAAAMDLANDHMKTAGRSRWDYRDYQVAIEAYERLSVNMTLPFDAP